MMPSPIKHLSLPMARCIPPSKHLSPTLAHTHTHQQMKSGLLVLGAGAASGSALEQRPFH